MEEEQVAIQSLPYFRNYLGLPLTDDSMKSVPHAKLELYVHVVLYKFTQLGSIVGTVLGSGYAIAKKAPVLKFAMTGAKYGVVAGIPIGFVTLSSLMALMKKNKDVDMDYIYYDHAYRIRVNRKVMYVDRMGILGTGAGAITAAVTAGGLTAAGAPLIAGGAAIGLAAGTVTGSGLNTALKFKRLVQHVLNIAYS